MTKKPEKKRGFSVGRVLDRAISVVSPGWAARRASSRYQFEKIRASEAGVWDRTSARSRPTPRGPKEHGRAKLADIRLQARDLYRVNPYARGLVNSLVANLVGCGVRPSPRVMQPRLGELDKKLNEQIREEWKRFEDKADITGKRSVYDHQEMMMRERIICGEAIAIRTKSPDASSEEIPFRVEVLAPERLAHDVDKELIENRELAGIIVQGVEFNAFGEIVAYWIYPNHPSDFGIQSMLTNEPRRVPAENVLHAPDLLEAGQVRGLSRFAAAAPSLEKLAAYLDSELDKNNAASKLAVMIKSNNPEAKLPGTGDETDDTDDAGNEVGQLESCMIWKGEPDEDLAIVSPTIQTTGADLFVRMMLRQTATTMGTSYELLARDLTQVTYLSARTGENEDRRQFEPQQDSQNRLYNNPVYIEWLKAGVLTGRLKKPRSMPFERFAQFAQVRPGRTWIDPEKDIAAEIDGIMAGLESPIECIERRGKDPEKILEDMKRYKAMAEEKGLDLTIFEKKEKQTSAMAEVTARRRARQLEASRT